MVDPVVLFFLLGAMAGFVRSDLRLPEALYETLTILLLLSIGLKGGVELARQPLLAIAPRAGAVTALGLLLPLLAYPLLRKAGRLSRADAASIAAHYGSVSVGTYAVALAHLATRHIDAGEGSALYVALLEAPAIFVGIWLARRGGARGRPVRWRALLREVVLGRSVVLLMGGLAIGWAAGPDGMQPLEPLFFDLFKGLLALFLLELGMVAARRAGELRRTGLFLILFGIAMPLFSSLLGGLLGVALGMSVGETALLATLAASASYIAVPAAMRLAVPEANPALSLAASLGVTFPFNVLVGIPLYLGLARQLHGL